VRIRHVDHVAPSIRKNMAITSATSGGLSVGIVRSRTQTMELFFYDRKSVYFRFSADGILLQANPLLRATRYYTKCANKTNVLDSTTCSSDTHRCIVWHISFSRELLATLQTKKHGTLHATRRFTILFTRASHWTLFRARRIQFRLPSSNLIRLAYL
jgi:hypothetical protein